MSRAPILNISTFPMLNLAPLKFRVHVHKADFGLLDANWKQMAQSDWGSLRSPSPMDKSQHSYLSSLCLRPTQQF